MKWSYEECKGVALECKTKTELFDNYRSVYNVIHINKWFELIDHFIELRKPNCYWTYERCEEVSILCKTKTEMIKKYNTAYYIIKKNDWFELMEHFIKFSIPREYWTYEKCKEVALKCENRSQFIKKYNTAYEVINQNKWFELIIHFIELRKPNGYWTYEKCKEVTLECKTKIELNNKYESVYKIIKRNKWFELISHLKNTNMRKRLIYVYEFSDNHCYVGLTCDIKIRNKDHLKKDSTSSVYKYIIKSGLKPKLHIKTEYVPVEEAILLEEKTLNEYKEKGWFVLNKSKTGGIGSPNIKWTKEMCIIEAKKYDKITIFQNNSSSSYNSALRNGWNNEICKHMKRCKSKKGYWNNKELCRIESKKYKNISSFEKECWSACKYSRKNGWLNEFFPNSVNIKKTQVVQQSR